jgi:hypothetical protein
MNIRELIRPQLEEFQQSRVKQKAEEINQCRAELNANELNILAVAAVPSWKLNFIRSFVTRGCHYGSKWIVEIDEGLLKKVLRGEEYRIASEGEKYVNKLEQKIAKELPGDKVVSVNLEGDLWKQSRLTVTVESGRIVTFVTQTIVNQTRYGDCFFQFPTRVRQRHV